MAKTEFDAAEKDSKMADCDTSHFKGAMRRIEERGRATMTEEKGFKIFNASGHPITQEGVEVVGSVEVPNVDLEHPQAIFALALEIAKAARGACDDGIPIALPGMTTLSAFVLAMLQGMTGQFPIIAWAARKEGKFVWNRKWSIDLTAMRILMREDRGRNILSQSLIDRARKLI